MKIIDVRKKVLELRRKKGAKKLASEIGISVSSLYRFMNYDISLTGHKVSGKIIDYVAPSQELCNGPLYLGSDGYIFLIRSRFTLNRLNSVYSVYGYFGKLVNFFFLKSLYNFIECSEIHCYEYDDFQECVDEIAFGLNAKKRFSKYYS